ncbi:FMN-binding negative transcriptional regulator [Nonomuraea fuscirosea]|jgi:transcriptional regulator|uniref:FMN-binding negative transcriptional regulator n=1 Tax=Nonomuraea fuscirosea TaxID=1291556 RepID=UPI002DD7B83B|nr:FMN-binding negative transcriptional regulator [Nonomuraea fuscirosea]WSA48935.1 FMN-binding negative transcriptional regulator [Nonomuraea fuscirosea]
MYTFPRYAAQDPAQVDLLVRENPFALVVSATDGAPVATHVPVILEGDHVEGGTLLGHLARANPHWRSWESSPEVLVIFQGPHGYVSPTVYATDPAVPTWDYAAVHVTGRLEPLDDALEVVERTVEALESGRRPSWEATPASRERFRALLPGVVAFRVHVRTVQSMFKLSQDIDAERYARVRDSFAAENPRLADLMDRS